MLRPSVKLPLIDSALAGREVWKCAVRAYAPTISRWQGRHESVRSAPAAESAMKKKTAPRISFLNSSISQFLNSPLPLDAQLHHDVPAGLLLGVEVRDEAGEFPGSGRGDIGQRGIEVRVVEEIRNRAGESHTNPLGQRKALRQAQVMHVDSLAD